MLGRLLNDAEVRPSLFIWNGPILPARLDAWAHQQGWVLPADLRGLWCATGGGEMFESETVLGPFDDPLVGNAARVSETDVLGRNRWYVQSGLGPNRLVFHEGGLGVTFADLDARRYVVAESASPFAIHAAFDTLGLWYEGWIRAEYADRYALPA